MKSKENYYYWIRKRFNTEKEETPKRSATFIFLNKNVFFVVSIEKGQMDLMYRMDTLKLHLQ